MMDAPSGGVSEWLKEPAWKACVRENVPWVRIPPPPPFSSKIDQAQLFTQGILSAFYRHYCFLRYADNMPINQALLIKYGQSLKVKISQGEYSCIFVQPSY